MDKRGGLGALRDIYKARHINDKVEQTKVVMKGLTGRSYDNLSKADIRRAQMIVNELGRIVKGANRYAVKLKKRRGK